MLGTPVTTSNLGVPIVITKLILGMTGIGTGIREGAIEAVEEIGMQTLAGYRVGVILAPDTRSNIYWVLDLIQ
jgi:hypothetical protein